MCANKTFNNNQLAMTTFKIEGFLTYYIFRFQHIFDWVIFTKNSRKLIFLVLFLCRQPPVLLQTTGQSLNISLV